MIEENKKELLLVRNIAQISCFNRNKGVLSAVRGLITHRGKLYYERKDQKEGDYVYCRLKPNWGSAKRPFEFEEVTNANLNQFGETEHCIHLFNVYGLTIADKMFHRLSASSTRISITDTVVDYINIMYYNPTD